MATSWQLSTLQCALGGYWRNANTSGTGQAFSTWYFYVFRYYGNGFDEDGVASTHENGKRIQWITGAAGSGSITGSGSSWGSLSLDSSQQSGPPSSELEQQLHAVLELTSLAWE